MLPVIMRTNQAVTCSVYLLVESLDATLSCVGQVRRRTRYSIDTAITDPSPRLNYDIPTAEKVVFRGISETCLQLFSV